MKWFRHMTKAREDRAVEKLIIEFGVKGYGLYFYCLELIAGTLDAQNITFELEPDAEILARRLGMDTLEVERIMHKCIELGLFELSDAGRITCLKIGKYLDTSTTSNPEIRKIAKNAKEADDNQRKSENVKENHGHPKQIRLEEIRLEENKEEKIKPMSEADSELLKYLKAEHKNYAINICGYDDTAFRDNNNWGQFMRNCWPTVRTKDKNWIWSVLSAAYSDKWCNGPKGKFAVQVIFSAGVLKVLEPAIEKALDYKLTETRPPPPLPLVSDYEWILANDPKGVRGFLHGSGYDDPTIDKIFELAKAYKPEESIEP